MYKIIIKSEREIVMEGELPPLDDSNSFDQNYHSYKLLTEEERSNSYVIGYHDNNDEKRNYHKVWGNFKLKPTQMTVNFTTGEQFTFEPVSCNVPDITLQVGDMLSELGRKNVVSIVFDEQGERGEWKFVE